MSLTIGEDPIHYPEEHQIARVGRKKIVEVFGVDHNFDNEEVHPGSFCNNCYLTAKRALHSAKNHPIPACVEWLPHDYSYCHICDGQHKGRPKKLTHPGGHPSFLTTHIRSVASNIPTFTLSQVIDNLHK